jgi:hypothetical protein
MHADRGGVAVVNRAFRGLPAGIWVRLVDDRITALPAAVALCLLGFGGVAAGAIDSAYPGSLRLSIVVSGLGGLAMAFLLATRPQNLARNHLVRPALLLAAGFGGMALTNPGIQRLQPDHPLIGSALEGAIHLGFAATAAGFLLIAAAGAFPMTRGVLDGSGLLAVVGLAIFATSQIVWGLSMLAYETAIAYPSLGAGLAAAAAAHTVPRIRHLETL